MLQSMGSQRVDMTWQLNNNKVYVYSTDFVQIQLIHVKYILKKYMYSYYIHMGYICAYI